MQKLVWVQKSGNFRGPDLKSTTPIFVKQDKVFIEFEEIKRDISLTEMDNSYSTSGFMECFIANLTDEVLCYIDEEMNYSKLIDKKEADNNIKVVLTRDLTEEQIKLVKDKIESMVPKTETRVMNNVEYIINNIITFEQFHLMEDFLVKDDEDIKRYKEYSLYCNYQLKVK